MAGLLDTERVAAISRMLVEYHGTKPGKLPSIYLGIPIDHFDKETLMAIVNAQMKEMTTMLHNHRHMMDFLSEG